VFFSSLIISDFYSEKTHPVFKYMNLIDASLSCSDVGVRKSILGAKKQNTKCQSDKRKKEKECDKHSYLGDREMELESGGEEVDFEKEQRDKVRVEKPQDILKVVARSVLANQEEPVEILSSTFLNNLVSDRMDVDLGTEYEREIHEIVQDLEALGREAGLDGSPARAVKEELIEREEVSRESRKKGDGKTSSDSAEEVEHI